MKSITHFPGRFPLIALISVLVHFGIFAQTGDPITLVGRWAEGPCYSAILDNEVAIMNNGCYMVLVDVSDPAAPVELSRVLTPSFIYGFTVHDDYVYIANEDNGLRIVDISDPANPIETGYVEIGGFYGKVWYHEGYIFHTTNASISLHIIDVSDPAEPEVVRGMDLYSRSRIAIDGEYMYVAARWDGFRLYSIADIENPVYLDSISGMYSQDVTVYEGYAYVAALDSVVIYDLSDPASPVAVSTIYPEFGSLSTCKVQDTLAYISQGNGMRIISVSDPAAPFQISRITSDRGFVIDLFVQDTLGFICQQ